MAAATIPFQQRSGHPRFWLFWGVNPRLMPALIAVSGGIRSLHGPVRMPEDIDPPAMLNTSVIGPNHGPLIRRGTLWFARVDDSAYGNHAFARRNVSDLLDVAVNEFQVVEEVLERLSHGVSTSIEGATRADEEHVGGLRKQALKHRSVLQRVSFKQLPVQVAIRRQYPFIESRSCLSMQIRRHREGNGGRETSAAMAGHCSPPPPRYVRRTPDQLREPRQPADEAR